MPHLITNRARQFTSALNRGQFTWESINAFIYCLGGLTFIMGSILFLPHFEKLSKWGAWAFIGGSILYLIVTFHDLVESIQYFRSHQNEDRPHLIEFLAAGVYVSGTVLFIIGSIFFLPDFNRVTPAAWCFILGSLLFVIGAFLNILQIIKAGSMLTLELLNGTAISFIVGSVLFLTASVPYLWPIGNKNDRFLFFTYIGWEYIIGSTLFFIGGVINYYRAFKVKRGGGTMPFAGPNS